MLLGASPNGFNSSKSCRINLIDLAGPDRDKVDGMGRHSLRETKNVKKSLSQLGVEHLLNAIGNLELTGPYAEALSQLSYKLEEVAHLVHHLQLYIFIILESGVLNE
ncbi:hypothetical protein RYX36_005462 [Vicia faba]